jgi:hypothetical protein
VRRLALFLERSIDEGTQWAVFESNGEALWSELRRRVEKVHREGALHRSMHFRERGAFLALRDGLCANRAGRRAHIP